MNTPLFVIYGVLLLGLTGIRRISRLELDPRQSAEEFCPNRSAIIPARIARLMAVIPDTSEVSERWTLRALANALIYSVLGILIFVARVRADRQADALSSLEGDRRGQERRARDTDRRACPSACASSSPPRCTRCPIALFLSVFLIAACGLIYELIAGTLASYLLGDTVLQFSTIIGCYLFAMGIGSALSRFLHRGLVARFVSIELMVGVVGGFSSSLLFLAFAYTEAFRLVLVRGGDSGGHSGGPRNSAADANSERALSVSRAGFARPDFRLSGRAGRIAAVSDSAGSETRPGAFGDAVRDNQCRRRAVVHLLFREQIGRGARAARGMLVVLALLGGGMVFAERISSAADDNLYADEVIFSRNTPLSAHRAYAVEGRPAAVPQLASAVQLARRISLSRSSGASRPLRASRARAASWCWAAAMAWRFARS